MATSTLPPSSSSDQAQAPNNLLEDESCQFGRSAIHGPDSQQITTDANSDSSSFEPLSDGKAA